MSRYWPECEKPQHVEANKFLRVDFKNSNLTVRGIDLTEVEFKALWEVLRREFGDRVTCWQETTTRVDL